MIQKLTELVDKAKAKKMVRLAVAAAEDDAVLNAVKMAAADNIVKPILVGNKAEIEKVAASVGLDLTGIEIVHNDKSPEVSAKMAVALVKEGKADILMKGFVSTAGLLKAVLDKENGLRKGGVLSHVAFFESPYYHKLLCLTDVAMNIAPDFDTKVAILNNAVQACHSIGIECPKVAPVAAVEVLNPKMEPTVHAAMLTTMNKRGQIKGCIVDGPLALDNAIDKHAAEHKGIYSEVAGDADVILVPYIEVGNIFYKSLNFLGGAKSAAVIMGAAVPIVLTSRADTEECKMLSIALAAAMN